MSSSFSVKDDRVDWKCSIIFPSYSVPAYTQIYGLERSRQIQFPEPALRNVSDNGKLYLPVARDKSIYRSKWVIPHNPYFSRHVPLFQFLTATGRHYRGLVSLRAS